MKYQLHVKSKHAKTGKSGFSGPDTYVAVTMCPEGVEVPLALNAKVLKMRGIEIQYFGTGYGKHSGPRSSLGHAIARAEQFIRNQQKYVRYYDGVAVLEEPKETTR